MQLCRLTSVCPNESDLSLTDKLGERRFLGNDPKSTYKLK